MSEKFSRFIFAMLVVCIFTNASAQNLALKKVYSVSNEAPHSAFTDLIKHKKVFYCVFREGNGHIPHGENGDGVIKIRTSKNGKKWQTLVVLEKEGVDLRDPKISVMPNGNLMALMGGSVYRDGKYISRATHVSFSEDGKTFSDPTPVDIDKFDEHWLWRVTWHGDTGYGISYFGQPSQAALLATKDGVNYKVIKKFGLDGQPNEGTIRFDGDKMIVLLRTAGKDNRAVVGNALPPYDNWEWNTLDIFLGGPEFTVLGDKLIAAGRKHPEKEGETVATVVGAFDLQGNWKEYFKVPSNNDTSYPGMVVDKKKIWMSYYSGHQGNTAIYIAEILID